MAKAIPDIAIEVHDVSEEIAALREAVEVLEGMEGSPLDYEILADEGEWTIAASEAIEVLEDRYEDVLRYARRLSENYQRCADDKYKAEVERDELRLQRDGYEIMLRNGRKLTADLDAKLQDARNELERRRGMAPDATGDEILSLVLEGYGVTIRPGFDNKTAMVDVEKRGPGAIRHANTRALEIDRARNPILPELAYTINKTANQLRQAIRSPFARGGVITADDLKKWREANPGANFGGYPY